VIPLPGKRLYDDRRWRRARRDYLDAHPFCAFCQKAGRLVAATIVDHIIPHRGDRALFWRTSNWQTLCATCHSSTKQRIEAGDFGTGEDGWPLSPD